MGSGRTPAVVASPADAGADVSGAGRGWPDFPAAHSMDTTWFGVDRDGHVAVFDSGEPGAVPESVEPGGPPGVRAELDRLEEVGRPRPQLAGLLHPGLRAGTPPVRQRPRIRPAGTDFVEILLFDGDPELPAQVLALPGLDLGRLGPWSSVVFAPDELGSLGDPRLEAWRELQRAVVRNPRFVTADSWSGVELAAARRGLYTYRAHQERFYVSEPYGRWLDPARVVHLSGLPRGLVRLLDRAPRFDLSFPGTPYLQPLEHVGCRTWEIRAWLASDGRTLRPVPGHERAYARPLRVDDERRFEPARFDPPLESDAAG